MESVPSPQPRLRICVGECSIELSEPAVRLRFESPSARVYFFSILLVALEMKALATPQDELPFVPLAHILDRLWALATVDGGDFRSPDSLAQSIYHTWRVRLDPASPRCKYRLSRKLTEKEELAIESLFETEPGRANVRTALRLCVSARCIDIVDLSALDDATTPLRGVASRPQTTIAPVATDAAEMIHAIRASERDRCADVDVLGIRAPLKEVYQELPLLHLATPNPLRSRGGDRQRQEDPSEALRAAEIRRWEDEVLHPGAAITYEPIGLDDVLDNFRAVVRGMESDVPRFVLLGPPGSGKTTLIQYLAWRTASGDLRVGGRSLLPVRIRLSWWERWAVTHQEFRLSKYLDASYARADPNMTLTSCRWERWLSQGRAMLLLDGLDELGRFDERDVSHTALRDAVRDYRLCPTVLTGRTVGPEYHRSICPDFPVFMLGDLDLGKRNAYILRHPSKGGFDREGLIEEIDRNRSLQALAVNPLLLCMICHACSSPRSVEGPITKSDLYRNVISRLLGAHRRTKVRYPGAEMGTVDKRLVLERLALKMLLSGQRPIMFTEEQLGLELNQALRAAQYGNATGAWANAVRDDLLHNSALLRGNENDGYFFLHLTIQEYLAASAIARVIDESPQGWDSTVGRSEVGCSVGHLVSRRAWDPLWQEVIVFLAGLLDDPTPLLEMLADPKPANANPSGDDVFRHRLALAAHCAAEIPASKRDRVGPLIDDITAEVFSLWWHHTRENRTPAVRHLSALLSRLCEANIRLGNATLPDRIHEEMRRKDPHAQQTALKALGHVGKAGATPAVLGVLAKLLGGLDDDLASAALDTVCLLGNAAAVPNVLTCLARSLKGPHADTPLRAITRIGKMAATPRIITRLLVLLGNDATARASAKALSALGEIPVDRRVYARVERLLRSRHSSVRAAVTEVIASLGAPFAAPGIQERLHELVFDTDHAVRCGAIRALLMTAADDWRSTLVARLTHMLDSGPIGAREKAIRGITGLVATKTAPDLLAKLGAFLGSEDAWLRGAAFWAINSIGPEAATPEILSRVQTLLDDDDAKRREMGIAASWALKGAGATPGIVARLTGVLDGRDSILEGRALVALSELGAPLTPEISEAIGRLVDDDDSLPCTIYVMNRFAAAWATPETVKRLARIRYTGDIVRWGVAEVAMRQVGAAASDTRCLATLERDLDDSQEDVRLAALEAICLWGRKAATPSFLGRIAKALAKDDYKSPYVWALCELGEAAATPEILTCMARWLRDGPRAVRKAAAFALASLGSAAATPEMVASLPLALRDRDEDMGAKLAEFIGRSEGRVRIFECASGEWKVVPLDKLCGIDGSW